MPSSYFMQTYFGLPLRVLTLAAVLLFSRSCFAQSSSEITNSTAAVLTDLMNAGNSDSIYALCSPSFRKAEQADHFRNVLQKEMHVLGPISGIRKRGRVGVLADRADLLS